MAGSGPPNRDGLASILGRLIYDMQKKPIYWLVFDWKDNYDRQASMQGLTAFSLEKSYELAKMLGKEKEARDWPPYRRPDKEKPPGKHSMTKRTG